MFVRAEAIITQLVFEHALRIRVKAETSNGTSTNTAATGSSPAIPATLDSRSIADNQATDAVSDDNVGDEAVCLSGVSVVDDGRVSTPQDSSASITSSSSASKKKIKTPKDIRTDNTSVKPSADGRNLVGKLNNLVTTDLGNITGARDLFFYLIQVPLQIALCIVYLYVVLGWR